MPSNSPALLKFSVPGRNAVFNMYTINERRGHRFTILSVDIILPGNGVK